MNGTVRAGASWREEMKTLQPVPIFVSSPLPAVLGALALAAYRRQGVVLSHRHPEARVAAVGPMWSMRTMGAGQAGVRFPPALAGAA